ncbi:hypothetical protein MPER_00844 [Moniliophthora perniciosa FA553]|nr:hypothetical protein MPER_00844 [Moniliophthora perniciosa FA553]
MGSYDECILNGLASLGFSRVTRLFQLSLFNYIIDTYLMFAASALAANTVVRSLFGAAFPLVGHSAKLMGTQLFARQMYAALGPRWASSLLGFIALAMTPIPFIFIKFGSRLREKSKYAPSTPSRPKESNTSSA